MTGGGCARGRGRRVCAGKDGMYVGLRARPTSISPCIQPSRRRPSHSLSQNNRQDNLTTPSQAPNRQARKLHSCSPLACCRCSLHPFERPAWHERPMETPPCTTPLPFSGAIFPRDMSSNDTHWLGTDSMERGPIASHKSYTNHLPYPTCIPHPHPVLPLPPHRPSPRGNKDY
jgi:hypothetical protein